MCLVVYLVVFDEEMSYLLRDNDPKTMHQAYRIEMDIENNLKYGIPKGYLSARVCCPKMLDVEERCESKGKGQYQSIYIPSNFTNHDMNYDSNKKCE